MIKFTLALFAFIASMFTAYAFAQDAALPPEEFFKQVLATLQSLGGMYPTVKLSALITLAISSMKVTYLNTVIWSKLGKLQIWLAPLFGLLAGVLALGRDLTPASALAYITVGMGAVFVHEIFDMIKLIPGIGPFWVFIINMIEGSLGGGAPKPLKK